MNKEAFLNDIPLDLAVRSKAGISFNPEKRGEQIREGYADTLAQDYAGFQKVIESKPDMQAALDAEFERYRQGYRQRYLAMLHSDSRIVSTMIAGPSNFPVRQMEKRNNVAHKRLEEVISFRERARSAITKTLCPELRPIMSGDSDAVERLREKLSEAEKLQERMKTANTIIRKHFKDKPQGATALQSAGFTEGQARRMMTEPDCFGGYGFASFELTNNGANIRRMKERLSGLEKAKVAPAVEVEGQNARLEDSPAENRIRIFFPGKPSAEIRSRLKSNGFRWSPTIGCWQAYRNYNAIECAKREAGLTQQQAA